MHRWATLCGLAQSVATVWMRHSLGLVQSLCQLKLPWIKQAPGSAGVCNVLLLPVQVCWHKFQAYFEIEPRYVPVTVDMPVMTPETAKKYIDDNTIGELPPAICCSSCKHWNLVISPAQHA